MSNAGVKTVLTMVYEDLKMLEAGVWVPTSASTSTPRRPTGSICRSTCWRSSRRIPTSPAGTGSASSCRPMASAPARSWVERAGMNSSVE